VLADSTLDQTTRRLSKVIGFETGMEGGGGASEFGGDDISKNNESIEIA